MNDEEFSKIIHAQVIGEQQIHICNQLNCTDSKSAHEDAWADVLEALSGLTPEIKSKIAVFATQMCVDSVSHVLGILDGTSILENHRDEFKLTYGKSKKTLNGDLQTYFLTEREQ